MLIELKCWLAGSTVVPQVGSSIPLGTWRPAPTEGRNYNVRVRYSKKIRLPREAYANPDLRFHIVMRTHPEVGNLPTSVRDVIWGSVIEQASSARIQLLAACLMADHLHMLAGPGDLDIIAFCDAWKSWSTRLAWGAGHRGQLWQPSMYDVAIRDERQFENAALYVVDNPVRAGLCRTAAEWPHAWAYWWDTPKL